MSSCGFRLRGSVEVPVELKNVHIEGIDEFSDLYRELKRVLQRSGSTLSASPTPDASILTILNEQMIKRVLSVDAQGRAAEYELNYRFTFTVTKNKAKQEIETDKASITKTTLVPPQTIRLTRDFRFDPDNILATDAQEKQIRLDMVRFSVQQVLRRIQSHLKFNKGGVKQPGS